MRYRIHHRTEYRYDRPVFLEPHRIRLTPASGPDQLVRETTFRVDPEPAGISATLDPDHNIVQTAWFSGTIDRLVLTSALEVETLRDNPFDYLPADPGTLPVPYGEHADALHRFLVRETGPHAEVDAFAETLASTVSHRTLPFLSALNDCIYRTIECVVRDEGDPFPAAHTLGLEAAACRDLTVLFVDACRSRGLAARFTSGYQEGDIDQEHRHLHAWPEVYIPGGGWRGYDPSLGLTVADGHIRIAAAPTPAGAAPVTGSFRGTDAEAAIHSELDLVRLDPPPAAE